jgi:hypothetical protein
MMPFDPIFMALIGALYAVFLIALFSSIVVIPLLTMIYFFADNPKGVISKILSYKFLAGSIVVGVVGLGMFLNELLIGIGFAEEGFGGEQELNLDVLRGSIIAIIVALAVYHCLPRLRKNTIFSLCAAEEKLAENEKKEYSQFIEHTLLTVIVGTLIAVAIFLFAFVLNYFFGFVLTEAEENPIDFVDFINTFFAVGVPLALAGAFFGMVARKKILFIAEEIKSPFKRATHSVIASAAAFFFTIALGVITYHIFDSLFSEFGEFNLDVIRTSILGLFLSGATFGFTTFHSPCAKMICAKICSQHCCASSCKKEEAKTEEK